MLPDYATTTNKKVFLPSSRRPPLSLISPWSKLIKDGRFEPFLVFKLSSIG